MRNGQPDGYWKSFYESGILKSEGNRLNYELDSLWKFYNEQGRLILEITYRNGKKNGVKTSRLDKETIHENYVNDVKEGYTRYELPDGTKKMDIPFVKGLEQGIGKGYSPDGEVITITEYKKGFIVDRMKINRWDKNGQKQGKWITFWENGKIKTEGTFRDDRKNGYFKEYSEKGDLIAIAKYIDGALQPEAEEIQKLEVEKEYYADGKIKKTSLYRNGILEGVSREFSPEGVMTKAIEYHEGIKSGEGLVLEDGSRTGHWREFYPDSALKAEGDYENGNKTGSWKFYHPNGKMEQTGVYNKQGKPEGTWKWYHDNGQLQREEIYYHGEKDGLSEEFDENGTLIEQGEYLNGLEDGPWIQRIGDFYQRGSYRDGLRTGMWVSYQLIDGETGTDSLLIFQGAFIDDLPDGKHTYYWENGKVRDEGIFVMGKKEGNWSKYNYDGSLFLVITYQNGIETRYDGMKIKPPFEPEE
ncbi:MAG: hypothetical protein V1733_00250 [bacterium]